MSRLDQALVSRGLARSRTHAARLIAEGKVSTNGEVLAKASLQVADDTSLDVAASSEDNYVSRAGHKLAGALARDGATARSGLVVLTSRVSIEMVQKSAAIGAQVLVAVSAPTALAVRMAEACGMTLVAIARKDGFEVFTHPRRIKGDLATHVA